MEEVEEVWRIEEDGQIPIGQVTDVGEPVARAARGEPLGVEQLQAVGSALAALRALRRFLDDRREPAPRLYDMARLVVVDEDLCDLLARAFDDEGRLSERVWPELGDLRRDIRTLDRRIRSTLEQLLGSPELAGLLQDSYVAQRGGRFVLPIKTSARKGLGIVHGMSQSGETAFVEPAQVVEPQNNKAIAEEVLRREEARILAQLSRRVGAQAEPIGIALDAALDIDLACARAGLGRTWRGVVPRIGTEGRMDLRKGRHPVLQLRGVPVVPNDISITGDLQAFLLTGPNAGGKTVALKMAGLAALLVRAGIPVPAERGSRVDFFESVLADIGDRQSVEGDLSTFSARLQVLAGLLEEAGPGSLVLLDEVGVGTEPAHGAALARAVLERLVERGATVVATTHYAALKSLAADDGRFSLVAVELVGDEPTYRLVVGVAGQSHALSTARRMGLPADVLERAEALLDSGEKTLLRLSEALEEELAQARLAREQGQARLAEVEARATRLAEQRTQLEAHRRDLKRELAESWVAKLRGHEEHARAIIRALQADPSSKAAGLALDEIRALTREARVPEPVPAPSPPERVELGDLVWVRTLGSHGTVTGVHKGRRYTVEVKGLATRVKLADLEPSRRSSPPPSPPPIVFAPSQEPDSHAVRTPVNTCDLRGHRVEEAFETVEQFLDRMTLGGQPTAFLLHGHGTGALKRGLRQWLPACHYAKAWRAAEDDEGGDAFTVVFLR